MQQISNFAILIISSDKYKDIWPIFFHFFYKNWENCPFKVYLGSNTVLNQVDPKIQNILSGGNLDWSTSLENILNKIPEKKLLIILEDFLIISQVNSKMVLEQFEYMEKYNVNHMHYYNPDVPFDSDIDDQYGEYHPGAPLRVNVFGFWDKNCLMKIIQHGESPWEFEILGSYRSTPFEKFLAIKNQPFKILNLVEKGSYIASSVAFCESLEVKLSYEQRGEWGQRMTLKNKLQAIYFKLMNKIPWKTRLKLMALLRKAFITY